MSKSIISGTLISGEEQNISKKISVKSIVSGSILLLVGGALFAAIELMKWESDSATFLSLGCAAIFFLVWGCVKLFSGKKTYFYSNSELHEYSCYLVSGSAQEAIRQIESQKLDSFSKLITSNESNLKLEFLVSKDNQFARCQVLTYIPYQFEPMCDAVSLSPENAEVLLKIMK